MKDLADEPFVLFHRAGAPELFDGIVGLCDRAGFAPRVVNEADLMQTVLTLVEAGEGVALVPACVGSGVVLRPVERHEYHQSDSPPECPGACASSRGG